MTELRINNLVKDWGSTRAVDNISFVAKEGTLTVLLGPSGCGKSTILRMVAGLESVEEGEVRISGRDVTREDPARRGVSMVFQSYALFPHLDVRENILFGLKVRRVSATEREKRLQEAAAMVGLQDFLGRKPSQLSGGQRQRVALARTIVSKQPICLMDEPLSNLDAKLRAEMRDEIHLLQRSLNLTMIYVTHDQTEAMSLADQVILLRKGKIVQIGTPLQLYEEPATSFAAQFIGTPPMNVVDRADLEIELGGERQGRLIGVRPEKIRFSDSGLAVEVSAIDYMGAETIVRLSHGRSSILARVEGRPDLSKGDHLCIEWNAHDLHFFDQEGMRISQQRD
ncbi:MAG TPA: ABC transporter ATP-binding protein [Gammaproteobacteria bacterium]|nr:ABC transporter ATP-binding protein [Arenicellales bacterium]HCX86890.1 ABC transporter ATP-binding protein [Gammaproteobacteria bacterium]